MLLLASTSDLLRLITGQSCTLDVHASYVDLNGNAVSPGRTNTPISAATTTTVVGSPGSSILRTVKTLSARNRHASNSVDVTVVHTDGTNAMELIFATLSPGDTLQYDEGNGFSVKDNLGRLKGKFDTFAPIIGSENSVVLASDVTNNNASANTIADVTALSFAVTSGFTYWFRFVIPYTSAVNTTGSRWAINGPASPTALYYSSRYTLTATSETVNYATAYDIPAAANASSLTGAGNVAVIEGIIVPSSNGTVIARFASEVSSSAIVAKAGALLRWMRVL